MKDRLVIFQELLARFSFPVITTSVNARAPGPPRGFDPMCTTPDNAHSRQAGRPARGPAITRAAAACFRSGLGTVSR